MKFGGGAAKVISILGKKLDSLGFRLFYLTFRDFDNKEAYTGAYHSFNEKYLINRFVKTRYIPKRAREIAKFCEKNKIDTVISNIFESNLPSIISKKFGNRAKIICVEHSNPSIITKNKFLKYLMKKIYPLADLIISVCYEMELIFKEEMEINNVQTIYNSIDFSDSLFRSDRNNNNNNNNNFNFLNIGRMIPAKGQWLLLRAFREVLNNNANVKLIIIGEGIYEKKLKKLAYELKLNENVIFIKNTTNINRYYQQADCFVFSSIREGFGIVLIEALMHNLPIVSFNT